MRKPIYIILTVLIMAITSRFIIRIVDATVQIDDDLGLLIFFLIVINLAIGFFSYSLYKKS